MAVSYKKLFHLMIDKGITNAELMEKGGFSANIITRLTARADRWTKTL